MTSYEGNRLGPGWMAGLVSPSAVFRSGSCCALCRSMPSPCASRLLCVCSATVRVRSSFRIMAIDQFGSPMREGGSLFIVKFCDRFCRPLSRGPGLTVSR